VLPWSIDVPDELSGGSEYGRFIEAVRLLQHRATAAAMPPDVMTGVTELLQEAAGRLAKWEVPESHRPAGRRPDLPGRGHPLLPPVVIDEESDRSARGRVWLGPYHLGGNGAAHGGVLPLIFDDAFGLVVRNAPGGRARTAFLTVNYRQIAPIETELSLDVSLDRVEGRKRWVSGRLLHRDEVVADAVGLFVELRPGQP
jgi:acyl-coenzyme A thioesterase PaaI-like protein